MAGRIGTREKRQVSELDFLPSPGEHVPVEVEELPKVNVDEILLIRCHSTLMLCCFVS